MWDPELVPPTLTIGSSCPMGEDLTPGSRRGGFPGEALNFLGMALSPCMTFSDTDFGLFGIFRRDTQNVQDCSGTCHSSNGRS